MRTIPLVVPGLTNAVETPARLLPMGRFCSTCRHGRALIVYAASLFALAGAVPFALAQYQPPPPPLTSAPCVPTKKEPCAPQPKPPETPATSDRFPFPGETPENRPANSKSGPKTPSSPQNPSTPDPAGKFPFPGEPEPAPSSSSSSSDPSSPDSSSDAADAEPKAGDSEAAGSTRTSRRHRLPKVEDIAHREAEDLDISHYYVTTGNFLAAYLRAKDAVKVVPEDAEAHYALAETAARLHKTEEATAEYDVFLKLDPENDKSKAARKALAALKTK